MLENRKPHRAGSKFTERNGTKDVKWKKGREIQDVARKERGRGKREEGKDFCYER